MICAIAIGVWTAGGALAQGEAEPPSDEPVIETKQDKPSDERIASRLQGIYKEIDSLNSLEVFVSEGVLTVRGEVASEDQAESALRLAKRIEGVVTVEDEIERSLDIEGNLTPKIQKYRADLEKFIRGLPLLGLALAVFLVIALFGHWFAKWRGLWKRLAPNPFLAELIAQAVRVAFIVLGLIVALNLIGAKALIGTVLGGAGVLGLAIGFAIRDTMENYISSIMLSVRQPFRANDHVVIGSDDGVVVRLTSRATILMTSDGNHLRIPNSAVFKSVILNYTRNPERRFGFVLGVDAEDDPLAAMNTAIEAVKTLGFVLEEPKPKAIIEAVGDSNISLKFTAWVNQSETDFSTARSLAIREAKDALEATGFTLPEPIYRLRFDADPAGLLGFATTGSPGQLERVEADEAPTASEADEAAVDTRPDKHLEERVDQERFESGEEDLLDEARPIE